MPEYAKALIVVAAVAFLLWSTFFGLPAIIGRLGGCHAAPDTSYRPDQAHGVMQRLIDCDTDTCAAKRAALDVLIAAGRVTPARTVR
ncbi:hypothetical protein [Nocardia amamiensis]|uniref:hypothetical protein n=1 Tax=Nocardia amamiensis TaxID=404578 RepID=UPI0033E9FDFE